MSIKMRNNKDENAFCCECGETQDEVLNLFDLNIGEAVFTLCDVCNEKLLKKCLSAEVFKNSRTKNRRDLTIINKRKRKEW